MIMASRELRRVDRVRQRRPADRHPGDREPAGEVPEPQGIISPTTVGILATAQVVATPKWKGKVIVTGLGTPDEMKAYVADGVAPAFILWNPANLGYLAAYAAVNLASKKITNAQGQTFTAGKLGKYTIGAGHTILLGPPTVFNSANINNFNF
jgi:rhamnose transport system substrate-binding protein